MSRLTVREAVKTLQARGLIIVSHGRRPEVAAPNADPVNDFFSAIVRRDPGKLLDLLEVRRGVEVQAAELAAARAGRDSLAAMHTALDEIRHAVESEESTQLNAADVRFHETIAVASGNQVLRLLIEGMVGPLHASRLESLRGHLERGREMADLIDEHARILKCIEDRDPAGAGAAMEMHLTETEHSLRARILGRDSSSPPVPATDSSD